ncbi:hypothetical protein L0664_03180 [Octadecabacter sp. G9-8]|uniref:DUF2125 domain-containing protein n=1 Tax=Octadecabacter dasysiphoniae TaxID=2909341 RepID=A0ABS9CUG4_9RHOB|nr:hypothetical protein [Octadecabacter dasysiphoniae]MCF2870060.1 hypothetical protein [Octadecabacter dasysiphoniae]
MKKVAAAALIAAIAAPLAAQEQMTRTSCQESYQRAADLVSPNDATVGLQIQFTRVTPDGWCQFLGTDPGFDTAPFASFDWRLEDSARWTRDGVPPLAVEVRIDGFTPEDTPPNGQTAIPSLSIEATLRQDPDAGMVILERAVVTNDFGDVLSVSGVFERVFLSSPSMMQVSMGSATFKAGLLSMTLGGEIENPFGFRGEVNVTGTPKSQSEAAFDAITRLPDGLMNDASRAELMAFSADLPKPVGTLEVSVASERGLGLMQVGSAMYSGFTSVMDEGTMSNEMEIMFDGLTVDANWSPAAQVAD